MRYEFSNMWSVILSLVLVAERVKGLTNATTTTVAPTGDDDIQEDYLSPNFCNGGLVQLDAISLRPVRCSTTERVCPTGYSCQTTNDFGTSRGYCCKPLSNAAPTTGCISGSRVMYNSQGQEIFCTPGSASACPSNGVCYYDSSSFRSKCCMTDPSNGCAAGFRPIVSTVTNQKVSCTRSSGTSTCPGSAQCHYNSQTRQYQCCRADSGCPAAKIPIFNVNGAIRTCNPKSSTPCPNSASCVYNVWTREYQCCLSDPGQCPVGQIPAIDVTTSTPRICIVGIPTTCGLGFSCVTSSKGKPMCCAQEGRCERSNQQMQKDQMGRAVLCTPGSIPTTTSCPMNSRCVLATGTVQGAYVCCSEPTNSVCNGGQTSGTCSQFNLFSCPTGYSCQRASTGQYACCSATPPTNPTCPDNRPPVSVFGSPQQCTPSIATSCSTGICTLASNNRYYCCSSQSGTLTCPAGYSVYLQGGQRVPCTGPPAFCNGGARCMNAVNPLTNQQTSSYLCCIAGQTRSHCPSNQVELKDSNGAVQLCTSTSRCTSTAFSCVPSLVYSAERVCCGINPCNPVSTFEPTFSFGQVEYCTFSNGRCTSPQSVCQTSLNGAPRACCKARTPLPTDSCPGGRAPLMRGTVVEACQFAGQTCSQQSYFCTSTAGRLICCPRATGLLTCPTGRTPLILTGTTVQTCSQLGANCQRAGYSCQNSVDGRRICCSSLTKPICPNSQTLLEINGQVATCNSQGTSCFQRAGYRCQRATNVNQFVCCGDQPATCPPGQVALNLNGIRNTCSFENQVCPQNSAYVCRRSTTGASQFVCCQGSVYKCPDNSLPLTTNGQPVQCFGRNQQCPQSRQHQCVQLIGSPLTNPLGCCAQQTYKCPDSSVPLTVNGQRVSCVAAGLTCPQSSQHQCVQLLANSNGVQPAGPLGCCSRQQQQQCPNNRQPLLVNGQPQICTFAGASCGISSTCTRSLTNQLICCQTFTNQQQCPNNRQPLLVNGQPQTCSFAGASCGISSTCTRSLTNQLICCQTSTNQQQCPNNRQPLLVNGQPQTCSFAGASCGISSTCTRSLTNQLICCQTSTNQQQCPNNQQTLVLNGQVQSCSFIGQACNQMTGYTCQRSTTGQRFVCCRPQQNQQQCPNNRQTLLTNGQPQSCSFQGQTCQLTGYTCERSIAGQLICCSAATSSVCPNNQPPLLSPGTNQVQLCTFQGQSCTVSGFTCQRSVNGQQFVCCSSGTTNGQCPSGSNAVIDGNQPRLCSVEGSICQGGAICRRSTSGQLICCLSSSAGECPSNQQVLLASGPGSTPESCTFQGQTCTEIGFTCLRTANGAMRCCGTKALCPPGGTAQELNGRVTQCSFGRGCQAGFTCQSAANANAQICCGSAFTGACPNGTPPLTSGGTTPISCNNIGTQCGSFGHTCQFSNALRRNVCCGGGTPTTDQCPSGGTIGNTCSPGASFPCAANSQCLIVNRSTNRYACCPFGGQQQTCANGQLAYMVNNSPQTCSAFALRACPTGFECSPSRAGSTSICCQGPRCRSGTTIYLSTGQPRYCFLGSSSVFGCPSGSACQSAGNRPGSNICCQNGLGFDSNSEDEVIVDDTGYPKNATIPTTPATPAADNTTMDASVLVAFGKFSWSTPPSN